MDGLSMNLGFEGDLGDTKRMSHVYLMPSQMHDILVLSNEQMKIGKKNDRKEGGCIN
jgi:hypothetical protein